MLDRSIQQIVGLARPPLSILIGEVGTCQMASDSSDSEVGVRTAVGIDRVAEVHVLDEPNGAVSLAEGTSGLDGAGLGDSQDIVRCYIDRQRGYRRCFWRPRASRRRIACEKVGDLSSKSRLEQGDGNVSSDAHFHRVQCPLTSCSRRLAAWSSWSERELVRAGCRFLSSERLARSATTS